MGTGKTMGFCMGLCRYGYSVSFSYLWKHCTHTCGVTGMYGFFIIIIIPFNIEF